MRTHSMMTRTLLALLLACLLLFTAVPAFAEPLTQVAELRVAVQTHEGQTFVFVSATIADDVTLPAQVPIAVPKGAEVVWVGELLGGEPTDDPETTHTLLETKDGWDILLVDLTQSRTLQLEATIDQSYLTTTGETTGTAAFSYVPATDVGVLTVAAESPANVSNFDQNTGYEVFGQGIGGGMIIGPSFEQAKAGQEYSVSYSFQTGTAADDTTTKEADQFGAVLILLLLALLALVAALLFIINRQQGGQLFAALAPHHDDHTTSDKTSQSHKHIAKGPKTPARKLRWNSPQVLIIALLVLGSIIALVWGSQRSATNITENNGVFSQTFGGGDPCQSVEFSLTNAALAEPEQTARELFKVMRESNLILISAKLDSTTGILTVEFCENNAADTDIAALIEQTGLVEGSSLKALDTPIVVDGSNLIWFLAQIDPCATNSFAIAQPASDPVAFLQTLADAVRTVPSITGVSYDSAAKVATFGFCEEQADDDTIAAALKAAGIEATLKTPTAPLTADSVFVR